MTESRAEQKVRLVRQNYSNSMLLKDMKRLSNNLFGMDKETRDKFSEFIELAYKQLAFQQDQIALLGECRDLDKQKATRDRFTDLERRLRANERASRGAENPDSCQKCGNSGWIAHLAKMCTCPFKAVWAAAERKRLGITS